MQDTQTHKQTFWFTIINYVGILIGVVSTILIYPNDKEFLGMIRYVDAIAQIIFPFLLFGGAQALIHFYPNLSATFREQLFKFNLFTILCLSLIVGSFLFVVNFFIENQDFKYVLYAFPLAIALAFIELLKRQATNLQKIAVPTFFDKIIPKLALPIIFLLVLGAYFSENFGLLIFVCSYFLVFLLLFFYVNRYFKISKEIKFKALFNQFKFKEYLNYSFFAFIGSLGSFFAFRIDAFMIPKFISFEANGTYSIAVTLTAALAIPATGLFAIYAPEISKLVKENNIAQLRMKYVESAKLLFFIGAVLLGCIFLGVDSLFQMMPTYDKLQPAIPIILILGINVLINMATGFNSEIISYSKFYKFNITSVLVLVVVNVSLNLFFLTQTQLGIIGVAYASLVAMVLFNFFKVIFIYKKFNITPFDLNYLKLIVLLFVVLFAIYLLPVTNNNLIDFSYKIVLNLLVSLFFVYQLKLVPSVTYWINKKLN